MKTLKMLVLAALLCSLFLTVAGCRLEDWVLIK
jgi:hypothetical protein